MGRNLGNLGWGRNVVIPSGYWMQPMNYASISPTLALGTMYALPWWPSRSGTITGVGIMVTSNGGAGSVCRFGLYTATDGLPDDLVADFGTVGTVVFNTMVTKTGLSQAVTPRPYFLTIVAQSAIGPSVRGSLENEWLCGDSTSTPGTTNTGCYTVTGISSGGLPSTFGTPSKNATSPAILYRMT